MKKAAVLLMFGAVALYSSDAAAEKRYRWLSIGCSPDYKMYSVKCEIGRTWQECGKEFCGFKLTTAPGTERARILADPARAPRLLAPDPGAPR